MNVLVVGAGIAGLTCALHARERGHRVTIVTKGSLGAGSTPLAQGGIAGWYAGDDSPQQHAADTEAAGAGLTDPAAVSVLVADAQERIRELAARGVAFDRAPDGSFSLGREAAHSHARIVHAGGDATGAALSHALVAAVRAADIGVAEHAALTDLVVHDGVVTGVQLRTSAGAQTVHADAVVIATGGAGNLFPRTTNPADVTGDGIAAALRAGAVVRDLEFVQFHPTVLALDGPPFLVSEAVRGDGATLIDDDGHRFLPDVHPDGELAPRDVVARAIAARAAAQGSPVRLDATHLGARYLAQRFPTIDAALRARGVDWSRTPIPVAPAAHYLMGGIVTDLAGRTSLPGLFAVGEAARTGVHGANRLASNSLLEGAVFGARAAQALDDGDVTGWPAAADASGAAPLPPAAASPGASFPAFRRRALQELMGRDAGLLRSADGLTRALGILDGWALALPLPESVTAQEDANLLLLARATVHAALARPESIGAHQLDAPDARGAGEHPTLIGASC